MNKIYLNENKNEYKKMIYLRSFVTQNKQYL